MDALLELDYYIERQTPEGYWVEVHGSSRDTEAAALELLLAAQERLGETVRLIRLEKFLVRGEPGASFADYIAAVSAISPGMTGVDSAGRELLQKLAPGPEAAAVMHAQGIDLSAFQEKAGWNIPQKMPGLLWHYFEKGKSLCGKWVTIREVELKERPEGDICIICRRMLEKREEAKQDEPGE